MSARRNRKSGGVVWIKHQPNAKLGCRCAKCCQRRQGCPGGGQARPSNTMNLLPRPAVRQSSVVVMRNQSYNAGSREAPLVKGLKTSIAPAGRTLDQSGSSGFAS
jgi:hypothetical protein